MSTSYYMYTVQDRNGKYACINPHYIVQGEDIVAATLRNWSRSYFGETAEKLEQIGMRLNFSKLPDEIKKQFSCSSESQQNNCFLAYEIEYDAIRSLVPKEQQHEFHGIYSKDRIFAFESGDIEDLFEEDIDPETYIKLDDTYKKKYAYYEWNDPFGWFVHIKDILERMNWQIQSWESVDSATSEGKYYLILIIC